MEIEKVNIKCEEDGETQKGKTRDQDQDLSKDLKKWLGALNCLSSLQNSTMFLHTHAMV